MNQWGERDSLLWDHSPAPAVMFVKDHDLGRPRLADAEQALTRARANRASLLACLDHATCHRLHTRVSALTVGIAGQLRLDGPFPEASRTSGPRGSHALAALGRCAMTGGHAAQAEV